MARLLERPLASPPTDEEKYTYVEATRPWHSLWVLGAFSIISAVMLTISQFAFASDRQWLVILFPFFILTVLYQGVSILANIFGYKFDLEEHRWLVSAWVGQRDADGLWPSVTILLPIAGEDIDTLLNTWNYVRKMQLRYKGPSEVRVLDDNPTGAENIEVQSLALSYRFGFKYTVRPNYGQMKKAGNLKYAYEVSRSEFLLVLDADFCPREDMLVELLTYMDAYPDAGIVQSPQFFRVLPGQNWLEQGAAAVQEIFYRVGQVARNGHHNSAICVGTCAMYRRAAWDAIGGPVLIEHSEDVHNGIAMRKAGWRLIYIPINLACGVCPTDFNAFLRQQYRWCRGSMSLLGSWQKFWCLKMPLRGRMCYVSGFLYYIYTAANSIFFPVVPLVIVWLIPGTAKLNNYLLILPCLFYGLIFYPLWHKCRFGLPARATRLVFGWAHLFCFFDLIRRRPLGWQPTGASAGFKTKTHPHIRQARYIIRYWSLAVGLGWMVGAIYRMMTGWGIINFVPLILSSITYIWVALLATGGARD